jgi:hypothetical protein
MRVPTGILAGVTIALSGSAISGPTETDLPRNPWDIRVCESPGAGAAGTTCAYLDQTLKLQVKHAAGPADMGKVLFDQKISRELAQRVLGRALSVIRSFGQAPPGTTVTPGDVYTLHLTIDRNVASVELWSLAGLDDAGPDMKELVELLSETTHAF